MWLDDQERSYGWPGSHACAVYAREPDCLKFSSVHQETYSRKCEFGIHYVAMTEGKQEYSKLDKPASATPKKPSKWATKTVNLIWVLAAVGIFWKFDGIQALKVHSHGLPLYAFAASSAILFTVFIYLTKYRPYKTGKKVEFQDWSRNCKREIQIGALSTVIAYISFNVILWRAYHIGSVPLNVLLSVGFLNLISMFWPGSLDHSI